MALSTDVKRLVFEPSMNVPFFDLTRQFQQIGDDLHAAVDDVLTSQRCIGGPHVQAIEDRLADLVGVSHAIGVSSGTDALLVSLMALDVGPGDEIITTPFTFFSPIGAILRRRAQPVFVDIDPRTFNLDAGQVEEKITERTRAILPVHLFGQACEMSTISKLACRHDIAVVEDMAQALDARHQDRPVGSFGTTGCLSFFPTKNLGAAGDGGMVFCDDDELAQRIRLLCRHGADPKYHHVALGGNFRLDALQAAILGVKLDHLRRWNDARRAHAAFYDEAFSDVDAITTPIEAPSNHCVYNQYTIRVPSRDRVHNALTERGVGTNVYYPEALHTQPALSQLGYSTGDFPHAERACREVLSLPVFPELTAQERQVVAESIIDVVG